MDRWDISFHVDFGPEFRELPDAAKIEIGAVFDVLRRFGPALGRPLIDTLDGSRYANMKEIRVLTESDWYRVALPSILKRGPSSFVAVGRAV